MNLYRFLDEHGIEFERFDHPPVYTVNDVKEHCTAIPGERVKNLFFRDKKGKRHFLVVVPADLRVNMKEMPAVLAADRVSFGSPDRLMKYLGIEPGSVSLLAVVNDRNMDVEVFIDQTLWESEFFQFHPLVNTSTLTVSRDMIVRFLKTTGHEMKLAEIPGEMV